MIDIPNHSFLAEELLCPVANRVDPMRLNMFNNQISQSLVLKEFDFPFVFTNFESQIGSYSTSYKRAQDEFKVIKIIQKNMYNKVYIIQNLRTKQFDVIERKEATCLTEKYGYRHVNKNLDSLKENQTVPKDSVLWHSTAYDDNLNYGFGRNLKVAYLSYDSLNYEDAIIISESAAEKMAVAFINVVDINLNPNDVLLNLFGNDTKYKGFPDLNEEVNSNLCAIRRFEYESFLYNFKDLKNINYLSDTVVNGHGKVIDIEIFNNADSKKLSSETYNSQTFKYLTQQEKFYTELNTTMTDIMSKSSNISENFEYLYSRSCAFVGKQKWANQGSEFSGTVMRFTLVEDCPVRTGDKISNRMGGKGINSCIKPDSEMPTTEDGETVDLVLSPFGIYARTNIGQFVETMINFYSAEILKQMIVDRDDIPYISKMYFKYIYVVSKEFCKFMYGKYTELETDNEREKFMNDIMFKENGEPFECLYIHQPPMFGNISLEEIFELVEMFPDLSPQKFVGIGQPLMMGYAYFMRLKHYAFSKFSARSAGTLNLKDVPSKNTTFKQDTSKFSKTPIRLGEMETINLFTLNDSKRLADFKKIYSSSSEERQNAITQLLTHDDVMNIESFEMNSKNDNILDILKQYFKVLGLELKNDKE